MVCAYNEYRVFKYSLGGELLYKVLKHKLELEIAGDIRLYLLGVGKVSHLSAVLLGHIVAAPVVVRVSADSHIVSAEGLVTVNIIRGGELSHFEVALRPCVGGIGYTVAVGVSVVASVCSDKGEAEIGMREMS